MLYAFLVINENYWRTYSASRPFDHWYQYVSSFFSHYTLARTHYIDVHNRHFLHLAHFYSLHPLIFNASPLSFYPLFCNTTLSIILESNRHFLYPILSHHIHGPTLLHFNPLSHSQCCLLILWYHIYYISAIYIFFYFTFSGFTNSKLVLLLCNLIWYPNFGIGFSFLVNFWMLITFRVLSKRNGYFFAAFFQKPNNNWTIFVLKCCLFMKMLKR